MAAHPLIGEEDIVGVPQGRLRKNRRNYTVWSRCNKHSRTPYVATGATDFLGCFRTWSILELAVGGLQCLGPLFTAEAFGQLYLSVALGIGGRPARFEKGLTHSLVDSRLNLATQPPWLF